MHFSIITSNKINFLDTTIIFCLHVPMTQSPKFKKPVKCIKETSTVFNLIKHCITSCLKLRRVHNIYKLNIIYLMCPCQNFRSDRQLCNAMTL